MLRSSKFDPLRYEGAPLIIARPQNEHSGHLKYAKDDPVFITTLEADLLAAKRGVKDGDVKMMLKRLIVFRFFQPLPNADDTLKPCACCFARFVLAPARMEVAALTTPRVQPGIGEKRSRLTRSPEVLGWNVEEVVCFVHRIGLGHLEEKLRESAVDGELLASLSVEDLMENLGVLKLQALKIKQRLPTQ